MFFEILAAVCGIFFAFCTACAIAGGCLYFYKSVMAYFCDDKDSGNDDKENKK